MDFVWRLWTCSWVDVSLRARWPGRYFPESSMFDRIVKSVKTCDVLTNNKKLTMLASQTFLRLSDSKKLSPDRKVISSGIRTFDLRVQNFFSQPYRRVVLSRSLNVLYICSNCLLGLLNDLARVSMTWINDCFKIWHLQVISERLRGKVLD